MLPSAFDRKRPRYNNSACLAAIGVTNAWADSALGNHTYEQLAAECHGLLAFDAVFIRPPPKSATTHGSTPESIFIKPLPDRLVSVIDNRLDHFNGAIKQEPRQLRATRYSLPAACRRAIAFMLAQGPSLPRWRRQQIAKMQALAKKIQNLTSALNKLPLATASVSVRMLDKGVEHTSVGVRSVNVGLMCLFCDVL